MKAQLMLPFVLVIGLAAPGMQCGVQIDLVKQQDFSAFRQFEFAQEPSMGYCPGLPFYRVVIDRQQDGAYVAAFSVIVQGQEGVDQCRTEFLSDDCLYASWASIENQGWDAYIHDDTSLAPATTQPAASDCGCPVLTDLPQQQLTDAEVQRLHDVFQAVTIHTQYWDSICVDGCLVERIRWDAYEVSSAESCMSGFYDNLDRESGRAIASLLEEIYQAGVSGSGS